MFAYTIRDILQAVVLGGLALVMLGIVGWAFVAGLIERIRGRGK